MTASALDERGWPPLVEDPEAAISRAGRSIGYLADHHSVVVTHCLAAPASGLLRRSIERELGEPVRSLPEPDAAAIGRFTAQRLVVLCATGTLERCHEDAADLALTLRADVLLLLIGEPVVWDAGDRRRAEPRGVRTASLASLPSVRVADTVAPVMTAARRFVETTGRVAAIGAIDHAEAMVAGVGGTQIRDDGSPVRFYGDASRSDAGTRCS